ncbi:hypothetical protein AX774_g747 [Zancudomyces culisetae]|uniref:Uncharacterized protein n=1 Tax=Zancudomyces culisetae TaxID=1213189 RepID=A0A1R1PXL1_ZANCU|nr:hypothetical protein AX774_g747 [Zancudomyces culisetae]|eukprot:OMH85696.1 hypothetical protein AX774_g747 [Zancudomyces culisetae]
MTSNSLFPTSNRTLQMDSAHAAHNTTWAMAARPPVALLPRSYSHSSAPACEDKSPAIVCCCPPFSFSSCKTSLSLRLFECSISTCWFGGNIYFKIRFRNLLTPHIFTPNFCAATTAALPPFLPSPTAPATSSFTIKCVTCCAEKNDSTFADSFFTPSDNCRVIISSIPSK